MVKGDVYDRGVRDSYYFGIRWQALLFFDFVNGFHDSANAIATVVGTKSTKARLCSKYAAIANFTGPFIFGTAVAGDGR